MIVADASLLVSLLTDGGSTGQAARKAFAESECVFVPDVAYVETVGLLRKQWLRGGLFADRCRAAIKDLNDLPLSSCPTRPLFASNFRDVGPCDYPGRLLCRSGRGAAVRSRDR